jgi:hypothetical protein
MSIASLKLFNTVPANTHKNSKYEFIKEYGVLITPSAIHKCEEIHKYLEEQVLNGKDLNKTFHKSWNKVKNASEEQLVIEQLLHYFSTYGLEAFGLYSEDTIYIPKEELDIPENLSLKVIKGTPKEELIQRAFNLFQMAMEQEQIEMALEVLEECDYSWTGEEVIPNKEVACMVYDRTGVLPSNGDELFRYLFFKATGSTLVIKNQKSFETIWNSNYQLPALSNAQLIELSKSYNRYKPLWMSLKKAHHANRTVINKINKLSKHCHEPLRPNILKSLTSKALDEEIVKNATKKANLANLVKALNAVRLYKVESENRYYRIRNGKGWAHKKVLSLPKETLHMYEEILFGELKERVRDTKVWWPSNISYAIPTSGKQVVGGIPTGTKIQLETYEESMLIGIYWEGDRVDLDLRSDSMRGSVGWNTSLRGKGLLHSGDITSAPQGATEFLHGTSIKCCQQIKVNLYSGPENHPFKLILGWGSDISKNYIIDPAKVIFQVDAEMRQKEILLGILDTDMSFYLVGQGSGGGRVGSYDKLSTIIESNLLARHKGQVRLDELIEPYSKEEADVILEPSAGVYESIMNLFH